MTTSTNQYKSEHSSCGRAPQASCGTQMTHGQKLPFLIDSERPQFDGVRIEGLDQRVVESWITLTSFTDRGKKAAGVRERAMLLALEHRVMSGETQKAWPTASTNCTSPASTPLREHPSPFSGLTLRLFPHSFVMSPISCMNRNAVTMMDGDCNYIQKQKENSTELEIMFCFLFIYLFFVSLLFRFISSEDAPSIFFFF